MGMDNSTGTFEYVHLRPIDTKEIRRSHTSIYLALNMRSFRFIVEMSLIQLRYESDLKGGGAVPGGFRAIWAWHLKCREGIRQLTSGSIHPLAAPFRPEVLFHCWSLLVTSHIDMNRF
jgi:hypothetical protein